LANNFLFCLFYYKSNLKTGANKRFENIISAFAEHISDDPPVLLRLIVDRLNRPNREMIDNKFFESYKWSNITRDLVSYFNQYRLHWSYK